MIKKMRVKKNKTKYDHDLHDQKTVFVYEEPKLLILLIRTQRNIF